MKQDNSIDDHVALFKMLVNNSQLDAASLVVIGMFQDSLPPHFQTWILTLENTPKTLDNWYEQAVKLDQLWRWMKAITERTKSKMEGTQRFVFPRQQKDPNVMDINAMSTEKWNKLMKDGKCFKCEKPGHVAKNCPEKKTSKDKKKPWGGKELHTHLQALLKELPEEEQDIFWDKSNDKGF